MPKGIPLARRIAPEAPPLFPVAVLDSADDKFRAIFEELNCAATLHLSDMRYLENFSCLQKKLENLKRRGGYEEIWSLRIDTALYFISRYYFKAVEFFRKSEVANFLRVSFFPFITITNNVDFWVEDVKDLISRMQRVERSYDDIRWYLFQIEGGRFQPVPLRTRSPWSQEAERPLMSDEDRFRQNLERASSIKDKAYQRYACITLSSALEELSQHVYADIVLWREFAMVAETLALEPYVDSQCAFHRHLYVKKHVLRNPLFFSMEKNGYLADIFGRNEAVGEMVVPSQEVEGGRVNLSPNRLEEFAFHLFPFIKPCFWLVLPGVPELLRRFLETKVIEKLSAMSMPDCSGARSEMFMDSRGEYLAFESHGPTLSESFDARGRANIELMCDKGLFPGAAVALREKNYEVIIDVIVSVVREYFSVYRGDISPDMHAIRDKQIENHQLWRAISGYYGGLRSQDALRLFILSLNMVNDYTLPRETVGEMQQIVRSALRVFLKARCISERFPETERYKHRLEGREEKFYELAKEVVDGLYENPRSAILAVGEPIKEGQSYSQHAFYIVLKIHENRCQIVICNGKRYGNQLLHLESDEIKGTDPQNLLATSFETFTLDEAAKGPLTHYIYRAIALEYQRELKPIKGSGGVSGATTQIYLRGDGKLEENQFEGYKQSPITFFKRVDDIEVSFPPQRTGNCTVHNLKYALKVLFDFDTLAVEMLTDTLMIGLDALITEYLEKAPQHPVGLTRS